MPQPKVQSKSTSEELKKLAEEHRKNLTEYRKDDEDTASHDYFVARKKELQLARQNVGGKNIEKVWRAADKAYVPHDLKQVGGTKVFASDDELGWRSTPVILGREDDWQENSVPVNPYVKIQTALNILIDRNPTAVFKSFIKRYEASSILHKELYRVNWDRAQSKEMLKTLVFNGSKYGVLLLQTAPLLIQRKVRDLVYFDPKDKNKNRYVDATVTKYDDVFRWALDPWTTWIDDSARPGDQFSIDDWMHYKDFSWAKFAERFVDFPNFKYCVPKSVKVATADDETGSTEEGRQSLEKEVVRLWFYESESRDMYYIETDDGVVLANLPIPKSPKNKRLSLSVAPWTLRSDKTIYGIGTYEAMRNDYKLYLKVRNMTMDQLVLSIYKEWFYEGTNTLQNTGEMRTKPGTGRQVSNAKNIKWNEIPGPGVEAWKALDYIKGDIDDATGISKTLEGELSPKAKAFDIAQAREASLRRMKTPLDNISYVLEQDAYISVGLFEELYTIPEVEQIVDPAKIAAFKTAVAGGLVPDVAPEQLEESEEPMMDAEGNETGVQNVLNVKHFREFPLFLDRDEEGNVLQTKEEKFFTPTPDDLPWEGKISIKGQSIIAESPLLEKQNTLELANLLIPLFEQPPSIVMPAAKQLLKKYDVDPEDWFPVPWLEYMKTGVDPMMNPMGMPPAAGPEEPLFVDAKKPPAQAQKVVPSTEVKPAGSDVRRFLSKLNPFSNP